MSARSALGGSAWVSQTTFPSDARYQSGVAGGIWTDRITNADRRLTVTDRQLGARRQSDGFGNFTPRDRHGQAKIIVERTMNAMPLQFRDKISSRTKWQAVELMAAGRIQEAAALLRGE